MQLFCLQLEASCLQWSFFYLQLTILVLLTIGALLLTALPFLLTIGAFLLCGKVRLIRALRDCKQRSLTASKEAPTVSKKASPNLFMQCAPAIYVKGFCCNGVRDWRVWELRRGPFYTPNRCPVYRWGRNHYILNSGELLKCM